MTTILSLATSAFTLLAMWLIARKDWRGWAVGLGNQLLWLALIVATQAWGLLLLMSALVVLYTRALVRWRHDEAATFVAGLRDDAIDRLVVGLAGSEVRPEWPRIVWWQIGMSGEPDAYGFGLRHRNGNTLVIGKGYRRKRDLDAALEHFEHAFHIEVI